MSSVAVKRFLLHPFVFAAYPVLALLAANVGQAEPLSAVRSVLACLILAGLLLLVFCPFVRSWTQAAVPASMTIVLFTSYGQAYRTAKSVMLLGFTLGRHRLLLGLWGVALLAVLWAVRRSKRELPSLTQILNVTALVAVALPLGQIGYHAIRSQSLQTTAAIVSETLPQQAGSAALTVPDGVQPPDIYYVILDTYTREDVLRSKLGFDPTTFLDGLRELGFYVAGCSRSNYANTESSLASSLNLQYLDTLAPKLMAARADRYDFTPFIQENAVMYLLRAAGYHTVALESGFSPTELRHAEAYHSESASLWSQMRSGVNPLEVMMLRSSLAMFLFGVERSELPYWLQVSLYDQAYLQHRDRILFELADLETLGRQPGPKFVFVHILAPHDPFVLGPNGEFVFRSYPFTLNDDLQNRNWSDYAQGYTGQVAYLNQRLLGILDRIVRDSRVPPVIILQGDHGIPRMEDPSERHAILNAYLLPSGAAQLYPTISPVNSFRVVFNTYLGGTYPMLEDTAHAAASPDDPYSFIQPAESSPACRAG
jgi:hypothetical protein